MWKICQIILGLWGTFVTYVICESTEHEHCWKGKDEAKFTIAEVLLSGKLLFNVKL